MIDQKRIAEEAAHFFEWPDPKNKDHVTLTSCVIFASTIAEWARKEERERWAKTFEQRADKRDKDDPFSRTLYALAMELRA